MKDFKLKPGVSRIYKIDQEVYREKTSLNMPYVRKGKDDTIRYFAVCPACNNPIQLVGLFGENPYGKHYCRSVSGVALHNENDYVQCPNASRNYRPPGKEERKQVAGELEINVYNIVREHFDQAIYILKQDIGIHITNDMAKEILIHYYNSEGWLYPWSFEYNIPWMLLFVYRGISIYGKLVAKESPLGKYLLNHNKYKLEPYNNRYYRVLTKEWVRSSVMLSKHRRKLEDDRLVETVELVYSEEEKGVREVKWRTEIRYNEKRFINLITSNKTEKYRDSELIEISQRVMPEI